MTLRAVLVDDEPLALERLERLLQATGRVALAGAFTDARRALAFLEETPVDVLFLDIHMPGMDGFALLASLAAPPAVVFTTAHEAHALQAFRADSVDYLLKPIDPGQLGEALTKVERRRAQAPLDPAALARLVAAALPAAPPTRIAARQGSRIAFLDLADIIYFHAKDKLTFAVTDGRAFTVDQGLGDLEARLGPGAFLRIHRSVLLNTAWIRDLQARPTGALLLRLRDARQSELLVPKARAADIRQALGI